MSFYEKEHISDCEIRHGARERGKLCILVFFCSKAERICKLVIYLVCAFEELNLK